MVDASTLLKIPKSGCPDIWIRLPKHTWPKSWSGMERVLWERQFEKVLMEHGWDNIFFNWECLFVNRARGLFPSVNLDDIKLTGKTENMEPTRNIHTKAVDLENQHPFLTMFIWVALKERVKQVMKIVAKDIANLRIKRFNNFSKSQHHAWMTINLKKKKMSQWENCPQFAHKLF